MEGVLGQLGGFDPMTQGLLSAAFRGLQMSGPSIGKPVSFGQVLGGAGEAGMNTYSQANKTQMDEAYRRRLMELEQVKTDMAKQQLLQARRKDQLLMGLLGGSGAAPGAVPPGAPQGTPTGPGAAPAVPGSFLSNPLQALAAQNLGLGGAVDLYKHMDTPTKAGPGDVLIPRNGQAPTSIASKEGVVFAPDGSMRRAPGAGVVAQLEGEKTQATERAKAGFDPYKLDPTSPTDTPRITTRLDVVDAARGAAPARAPTPGAFPRETRTGDAPGVPNSAAKAIALLKAEMASPGADVQALEKEIAGHAKRGMLTKAQVDAIQPGNSFGSQPAGVPSGMSTDTANRAKAEGAALEGKFKDDATRVTALEQKLPSLFSTARRIDKLEALTKDDKTYAAAGAELKTQLGSISQAFGLKVNQAKTANSEEYLAHIAELMKDRLASKDYGSGTGVSNLDLLSASKPLPELAKTAQGRQQIITALRADTQRAIQDSQAASDYFAQNNSLRGFRYPSESAEVKAPTPAKTVVKRGKYNGKNVVQYSDGSVSYE